jgi:hypothetical protein
MSYICFVTPLPSSDNAIGPNGGTAVALSLAKVTSLTYLNMGYTTPFLTTPYPCCSMMMCVCVLTKRFYTGPLAPALTKSPKLNIYTKI